MRLLIIGAMSGQIGAASQIAVNRGAQVAHAIDCVPDERRMNVESTVSNRDGAGAHNDRAVRGYRVGDAREISARQMRQDRAIGLIDGRLSNGTANRIV